MSTTISISANIPDELGRKLERVARADERSKSYHIKKSLERYLNEKIEELEDYEDAKAAYEEFLTSGEEVVPLDEVFKHVK